MASQAPTAREANKRLNGFAALMEEHFPDAAYAFFIKTKTGRLKYRTKGSTLDLMIAGQQLITSGIAIAMEERDEGLHERHEQEECDQDQEGEEWKQ